jgi:hypothetical protein
MESNFKLKIINLKINLKNDKIVKFEFQKESKRRKLIKV